jgi:hypothetical protein
MSNAGGKDASSDPPPRESSYDARRNAFINVAKKNGKLPAAGNAVCVHVCVCGCGCVYMCAFFVCNEDPPGKLVMILQGKNYFINVAKKNGEWPAAGNAVCVCVCVCESVKV